MALTQDEIFRYSRQLPILGISGQEKLKNSHVMVIGCGGLGCPALVQLCSAGIGKLTLYDQDSVELSNLARQTLYQPNDINQPKVQCAKQKLITQNPHCEINAICENIHSANINQHLQHCDVVIDASDNFKTRYLVNQHTRQYQIPLISASIFKQQAQISTFNLNEGPCYECLYPQQPPKAAIPNCANAGVVGTLTAIIGSLQAQLAINLLTNTGETLSGRVLTVDAHSLSFDTFFLKKNITCNPHFCNKEITMTADTPEEKAPIISPKELAQELKTKNKVTLIDVREDFECEICKIEGAKHIPLAQLEDEAKKLDPQQHYIVYCKAGVRGNKGAMILKKLGFKHIHNLAGGIIGWINDVDDSLKKY